MNNQNVKIILTSWGHPTSSYGGGETAKILYTPAKFEDFREILECKSNIDKPAGRIHYQDDDGDWVPIESQGEYDEALKYLRRATSPVSLRLTFAVKDKGSGRVKSSSTSGNNKLRVKEVERHLRKMQKEGVKCCTDRCVRHGSAGPSGTKECAHGKAAEKLKLKGTTAPPAWFEKYMQKFKGELLDEVQGMLEKQKDTSPKSLMCLQSLQSFEPLPPPVVLKTVDMGPCMTARASKCSRQGEQAGAMMSPLAYMEHMDQKSQKLMKKMCKSHNSEKKLKKLNLKLEQLELKRSRLLEWNRKRAEHLIQGLPPPPPPPQPIVPATPQMDAEVLSGGMLSDKCHVSHNEIFTKTWHVMNNGSAAWDDKTELRLAWLTQGLKPLESSVSCPTLKPGEEGDITIKFQAPGFAGLFESYWHFYHDEERFGQWMGCAVVVDPKQGESSDESSSNVATSVKCIKTIESDTPLLSLHDAIKEIQQSNVASEAGEESGSVSEARAEYDSDPDDNNNVSHSDNDNQYDSSDSDSDEDSESFVHVPMPSCYQYQAMPLFNIQPDQEDLSVAGVDDLKEQNSCSTKPNTPPTTPREPDSEEELFEEASEAGAVNHAEAPASTTSETGETSEQPTPTPAQQPQSQESENQVGASQPDTPPIHILPETFMTGAINVANRALSMSEAIMKTLNGTGFNVPPQVGAPISTGSQPSTPLSPGPSAPIVTPPQPQVVPIQPSFVSAGSPYLEMLQEMGFSNLSLNMALLAQHNNNLSQVVAELLSLARENP